MKKNIIFAIKIIVGISLLFYIFKYKFDFKIIEDVSLNWKIFIILFINSILICVLRSIKWGVITKKLYSIEYGFKTNWHITLMGQFFAFFTPSRLGDLIRANYIKKEIGFKKSVLVVLYDRIVDILVILILFSLGTLYFYPKLSLIAINNSINKIVLSGVVIILLVAVMIITFLILKKFKNKIKDMWDEVNLNKTPILLIYLFPLTLMIWLLTYLQYYLAFIVLGVNINLIEIILMVSIITVIYLLPISINGVGVREYSSSALFPLIGIIPEIAIMAAWLEMLSNSIFPAFLGYISFTIYKRKN